MKNNDININTEKMETIISSLEEKVNNVKTILADLDKKMKNIDGSSNVWKGKVQESVYRNYNTISKSFPKISEELTNYNEFLRKTVENYRSGDSAISENIDDSKEDLNVN